MTQHRHARARDLADLIGSAYDIIGNSLDGGAYGPGGYPCGQFGLAFGADPSTDPAAAAAMAAAPAPGQPVWHPGLRCWVPATPNPTLAASLIAAKKSFLAAPRAYNKARINVLGFPKYCLKSCETITLVTQPQCIAKVDRIVIPSTIAGQLRVLDFKVGKWSLFANGESIPALMFSELATDIEVNPDTADTSMNVSITLQNISKASIPLEIGAIVKCLE